VTARSLRRAGICVRLDIVALHKKTLTRVLPELFCSAASGAKAPGPPWPGGLGQLFFGTCDCQDCARGKGKNRMAGEDEGKPAAAAVPPVSAPVRKRKPKPVTITPVAKAAQLPAARGKIVKAPALRIGGVAAVPAEPATDPVVPQSRSSQIKPVQSKPARVEKITPKRIVTSSVAPKSAAAPTPRSAPLHPKKVKAEIKTAPVPGKTPPPIAQKDFIMDITSSYQNNFQDAYSEAQNKAKEAFEKGTSMLGEFGEFTRGNVEAIVESGKIFASGLQDLGASLAAESRSTFETITADLKELAAAKTPADFLKIQSDVIRKSFDGAVAYGSKNSEAALKLASDAFAPISGRVSLAVEKVRAGA
jgi:phasin family protein